MDETAILACAAYVDLNPIRAALADTIEQSDFTSAQKRCCDMQAQCSVARIQCAVDKDGKSALETRGVPLGDNSGQGARTTTTWNYENQPTLYLLP